MCRDEGKFLIQNQTKQELPTAEPGTLCAFTAPCRNLASRDLCRGWGLRGWSSARAQVQGQLGRGCASLVKLTNP